MGLSKKTNPHPRRYPGVKGRRPDNRKFRQTEAAERQAAYDALSVDERIALLDRRLGKGLGAVKQRARLAALKEMGTQMPSKNSSPAKEKLKAKERRALEK